MFSRTSAGLFWLSFARASNRVDAQAQPDSALRDTPGAGLVLAEAAAVRMPRLEVVGQPARAWRSSPPR